MRKRIGIVIGIVLAGIAFGMDGNLLINGDFETGAAPWVVSEWSNPRGKVSYKVTEHPVHAGKGAAEIRHISGGSNILLGQKVAIKGRKNLQLTFFAYGDVPPSTTTPISASFISVDSAGKKLQYVNKPFEATDHWEKCTWQFSTHPSTASVTIYLRCGEKRVWFDDASLTEMSGPSLTDLRLWYPSQEVIPALVSNAPGQIQVTASIKDSSGRLLLSKKLTLEPGKNFPVLKAKGICAGRWSLEIADASGTVAKQYFTWPEAGEEGTGRKNNFVTVLYEGKGVGINPGKPLVFENPRTGWLCLTLVAEKDATVNLENAPGKEIALKAGEKAEIMRYAQEGTCKLTASTHVKLLECDIRTIAELVFCEYEGMESRKQLFPLMKTPAVQAMLRNTNVIMEGFANGYTMNAETVTPEAAERIARWRASGRKLISHAIRTTARGAIKSAESTQYWSSRIGMTQFDGVAIDEFANETPEELKGYCEAARAINANASMHGRSIFAYSCAAWNQHQKSMEFRDILMEGDGIFAPEVYLREKQTIGESKSSIDRMFEYIRLWDKTLPGSMPRLNVVLSTTDGLPHYYGQDTFANVQYKVFLDLQYNLLANDPAFRDMRGISSWILRYTKPETILWLAMLNRHYCIEGNRDMLSERLGYQFYLPYLKNPDFAQGVKDWGIEAASNGSIVHEKVPGWGFGRGTCNVEGNGDDVIVMKRVPGKNNLISQTVSGLVPGRWYELSCRVADYDDVTGGQAIQKLMPLSMTLSGHEFDAELSFIDVYRSRHAMKPKFPGMGPCANEQRLFFKAKSSTALLTIRDDRVTPGVKSGSGVNANYATPRPEEVKNMMVNFIQVQEIIPPEQWHGVERQ